MAINAWNQVPIFLIDRVEPLGGASRGYHFNRLMRTVLGVRGKAGRFIRWQNKYRRLYDAAEIREFFREVRREKEVLSGAFVRYRIDKGDVLLPFVKTWEPSIGYYPEALYR